MMPATSVEQLRNRNKPVVRTVNGVVMTIKRPDVRYLVYTRMLPAPLLESVGALLEKWVGQDLKSVTKGDDGEEALHIIDVLVLSALVHPKCVRTEAERAALPEEQQANTITLEDLDTDMKERIVMWAMVPDQMVVAEATLASRFPGDGRGEGAAQDVQGVRTATVGSSTH